MAHRTIKGEARFAPAHVVRPCHEVEPSGARIYRVSDGGQPFGWLVHKMYLRGHLGPYKRCEALLLLLGGDIELNPGPSSDHWEAIYTARNKGLAKSAAACTQPRDGGLRWASFIIGGPTVDWDRLVTIVQLLADMCFDVLGL